MYDFNMSLYKSIFRNIPLPVIGMIHVQALPGTPFNKYPLEQIVEKACKEAETYKSLSLDGVIVENMHDIPYVKSGDLGPETISFMTRICSEVRKIITKPCGVQILAGCNKEALSVAKSSQYQFVRCEGFVFGHVADEGYIDASAGPLLRYRKNIDANDIAIFVDIKKKHCSHAITQDIDIVDTAKAAEFFEADGVIITGKSTGQPADEEELGKLKMSTRLPVLIGSGVNIDNLDKFVGADGLIVGSEFKEHGIWFNELCVDRIKIFLDKINTVRLK